MRIYSVYLGCIDGFYQIDLFRYCQLEHQLEHQMFSY